MSTKIKFDKNEKKNIWLEIYDRDSQDFDIDSATFVVLRDGSGVQVHKTCGIDGHRIYGLVDTTPDAFKSGITYEARFTIVIENESYIEKVYFEVR